MILSFLFVCRWTEESVTSSKDENSIGVMSETVNDGTLIEIYDSDDDDERSGMHITLNLTDDDTETIKNSEALEHIVANRNDGTANSNSKNEVEPNTASKCEFDLNKESHIMVSNRSNGIGGNRFKCEHCDKSFQAISSFQYHQRVHVLEKLIGVKPDSNGQYHCTLCIRTFSTVGFLNMHMKVSHIGNRKLYYCARCMSRFDQEAIKDKHERQCRGRYYECYFCRAFFDYNKDLLRHMKSKHILGTKPFRCKVCSKSFKDKSQLKFHMKTIHIDIYIRPWIFIGFACPLKLENKY